ncbi:MAG: metal-binding protein [Aquificaceae bacterium]
MALGKTHEAINLILLPAALYFVPKGFYFSFTLGYILGTFFLSPDIDIKHSKPSKRWRYMRFIWIPYQKGSRHRGFSHIPIVGTFIRLLYLNLSIVFLYFILIGVLRYTSPELSNIFISFDADRLLEHMAKKESAFFFLLGLIASEAFHVLLDIASTTLKRIL